MKTSIFMFIYLSASVSAEKTLRNRGSVHSIEKKSEIDNVEIEKAVAKEDEVYFGRLLETYSSYPVRSKLKV